MDRLDAICELLQVDVAELARGMPREDRLINRLSPAQEKELMSDPALLLIAVSALNQMRVDEIVETYRAEEAQCVALLLRLERIGILELHENNRIRLRISRTFSWIPDGPIMRYVKSQTADFFVYGFDLPGELMRLISVRISADAQVALLRQLEQIAREYSTTRMPRCRWRSVSRSASCSRCGLGNRRCSKHSGADKVHSSPQ